jgi:hypothetical protein
MRRRATPRRDRPDLLTRPPARSDDAASGWAALLLDPVAPLVELAELRRQGLISPHEYERQKAKVIDLEGPGARAEPRPQSCAGRPPRPPRAMPPRACGRSS